MGSVNNLALSVGMTNLGLKKNNDDSTFMLGRVYLKNHLKGTKV